MNFIETELADAWLIEPKVFRDPRGFFLESYSERVFRGHGITATFVQDNHSRSTQKNVLRGMHFQNPPHAQAKLIRCVQGAIFDVIADLRMGSSTYGKWQGFELTSDNMKILFVPQGFAHGFCTLTDTVEVLYKADDFYTPASDSGIRWNDPDIAIVWPTQQPLLSEKDAKLPFLKDSQLLF